jgi:hypothetical protein
VFEGFGVLVDAALVDADFLAQVGFPLPVAPDLVLGVFEPTRCQGHAAVVIDGDESASFGLAAGTAYIKHCSGAKGAGFGNGNALFA